jgi:hypothetical protein
MNLRELIADRLFGDLIHSRVAQAVKVVDDRWWRELGRAAAPQDRAWHEMRGELDQALEAWHDNPLAFRIVALTTDFVVGQGLRVRSTVPWVEEFLQCFWEHRQNRLPLRLYRWCDELTRAGELFLVLSTNPADGMSYVRELPMIWNASCATTSSPVNLPAAGGQPPAHQTPWRSPSSCCTTASTDPLVPCAARATWRLFCLGSSATKSGWKIGHASTASRALFSGM